MARKLIVVTHFRDDDKECWGDYCSIDILDEKGNLIETYGDYYHDKGDEKVQGFIDAIEYIDGEAPEVERKNVADYEV